MPVTKKEEYTGALMDIVLWCPIHGEQHHRLNDILSYHKCTCTQCKYDVMSEQRLYSQDYVKEYIESINENTLLNPEDYVGIHEANLNIKCGGCGRIYITSLHTYKGGQTRCGFCSHAISNGEKRISDYLNEINVQYIPEYRFNDCKDKRPLPFDFYLPDYNLCIEFQGSQHYRAEFNEESFRTTQIHDRMKYDFCRNKCIELLIIPYWEGHNIEAIIQRKIDEIGKRYSLVS